MQNKKIIYFYDKKEGENKKKDLFKKLNRPNTSEEDINFSESFNLAVNKTYKLCPKKIKIETKGDKNRG